MKVIERWSLGICIALTGCAVDSTWDSSQPGAEGPTVGQSRSAVTGATTPGSWTPMVNQPPILSGAGTLELMTDGSVLLNDGSTSWFKLTPDVSGSYVNGTWSQVKSSHIAKLFMPSTMLKDGRYLIAGGEYVAGDDHATVEIYDPVTDIWTREPDMPSTIGDTAASILPDGRFLCSSNGTPNAYLFDPLTNGWTFAGPIGTGGFGGEKGWTLLQDGTVLDTFDVGSRYSPVTNVWTATGPLPSALEGGAEIGPMSLLHSGKVVQFGGAVAPNVGHTAIYDPSSNVWAPGPDAPDGLQFGDSSAAVLVNGNVLCSTTQFISGGAVAAMWEYNPDAPPGVPAFTKVADGTAAFPGNPTPLLEPILLPLPNGQTLVTQEVDLSTNAFSIYTPSGAPQASWRPTITSVSSPASGVFTLTGTQLNGLTNGAAFGDDMNMASAYPIVYLTDAAGHVYYARSSNFDQMAPRPAAAGSCDFTLPLSLPSGSYDVRVSASGIASSNSVPLTVAGPHVTGLFSGSTSVDPGALTIWSVRISDPAPAGGLVINLRNSNPTVATVPATVTISPGGKSVNFLVMGAGYGATLITAETATPNPAFKPAARAFGWRLDSLAGPAMPASGTTATWTVSIDNAVHAAGIVVSLQSSTPAAATVPDTVTIPTGASSVSFPVTFTTAGGHTTISASLVGSPVLSQPFGFSVTFAPLPGSPANFDAPQTTGGVEPWTVRLDPPWPGGAAVIQLQSSDTAIVTVRPTVTVPATLNGALFAVSVGNNPVGNQATITASVPGSSATGLFGYRITSHTVSPVPVRIGPNGSVGTIGLNGVAPPAGLPVTYTAPSPAISLSIAAQTIASGQTQGGYTVFGQGTINAVATIRARIGTAGPFRNVIVQVAP